MKNVYFLLFLVGGVFFCFSLNHRVIDAKQFKDMVENCEYKDCVIIDVRTEDEFNSGHIKNAINLNFYDIKFEKKLSAIDRNKTILLYCRSGNRSGKSIPLFKKLKFKNVYELSGGILEWTRNGYELE